MYYFRKEKTFSWHHVHPDLHAGKRLVLTSLEILRLVLALHNAFLQYPEPPGGGLVLLWASFKLLLHDTLSVLGGNLDS